jgi:hypothetical protein
MWCSVVRENSREVVSILTTYRKKTQSGMRDEWEGTERVDVSPLPFIFQNRILKSKYLDNHLFKLRTVFIFKILVSRSSKLDPTLIGFMKLFFDVLPILAQLYFGCTRGSYIVLGISLWVYFWFNTIVFGVLSIQENCIFLNGGKSFALFD